MKFKIIAVALILLQTFELRANELDLVELAASVQGLSKLNSFRSDCSLTQAGANSSSESSELIAALNPGASEISKVVKVSLDSISDVPAGLREYIPGEVFERAKDGKVDVIISLPNDNAGLGLWQVVTKKRSGDDFGATHGLKMQVGKDVEGLYMQGVYETNLYTQQASNGFYDEDGRLSVYQFFTEENIAKFVVDNQNKGKATFWQAGVGFIELNSEDTRGWLTASGQQKVFHRATGSYKNINISDGLGKRTGVFAEGSIGSAISDVIARGGQVRLKTTGQVTGVISTLDEASSISAKTEAQGFYQSGKDKMAYTVTVGAESTFHQTANSPSTDVSAGVGMAGRRGGVKAEVRKTVAGARQNYVNYNTDKGMTYTLQFFRKIGTGRTPSEAVTLGSFRRN